MKILYLVPGCFDKGGISRYCRYQISALREIYGEEAIRAISLLGRGPGSIEEPFEVDWMGPSEEVTQGARVRFTLKAIQLCIGWRPDVILAAHVNLAPLQRRLAKWAGAVTVMNVYGLELWSGLSLARRRALWSVNHLISDCHSTAEHVQKEMLWPSSPEVIWDCADLKKFCPGERDESVARRLGFEASGARTVMFLGRLSTRARHKGVERLIRAFGLIHGDLPEARLLIAGDGDDRLRLERVASESPARDQIFFLGSVPEGDLPGVYRHADLFALVSEKGHAMGEGIPLTPIEALASGVPIVVGDEDGSQEAVIEGRNGWVVSPRVEGELARLMGDVLGLPDQDLAALSVSARTVAEERFSYRSFVEKHRSLFRRVDA